MRKRRRVYSLNGVFQSQNYKITSVDEKIIRRYVLILSDADNIDSYISIMAYIFRTDAANIKKILAGASERELADIEKIRRKQKKRQEGML